MRPDFGSTASDYAQHRAGFPDAFFDRLQAVGVGLPGQRVVDLGTGTGTLARGFSQRGCRVVGIDPSRPMLLAARRLAAAAGLDTAFFAARAEATGLANASRDVVAAGQCWHWFDRRAAAAEAARVLVRAGRLVIGHFDWIPLDGNVVEATEALIAAHNPAWKLGGGNGVYPMWLRTLAETGYRDLETWSSDLVVRYSPEGWRGRVRASAGVAATSSAERVAAFDVELAELLARRFPGPEIGVHHRIFTLVAHAPAG